MLRDDMTSPHGEIVDLLRDAAQRGRYLVRAVRQVDKQPRACVVLTWNRQHRSVFGLTERHGYPRDEGLPPRREDKLQRKERITGCPLDLPDPGTEVPDCAQAIQGKTLYLNTVFRMN